MRTGESAFLRVREAAVILGISNSATYELANAWLATDGGAGLPAVRMGRSIFDPARRDQPSGRHRQRGRSRDRPGELGLLARRVVESESIDGAVLVVSAASRALCRQMRPLAWVILEEIALDAVAEDGRLVARTSARQVADRLGVDPGTAAGALRDLQLLGVLELEREHGPAGRFGLSVYVLGSTAGLTVVRPSAAAPCVASPCVETPKVDESGRVVSDGGERRPVRPGAANPRLVKPHAAEPHTDMSGPVKIDTAQTTRTERPGTGAAQPGSQCLGQTAFDLGAVSS